MKQILTLISLSATFFFTSFTVSHARELRSLNQGWTFNKGFVRTGAVAGSFFGAAPVGEPVDLPHTWNAEDFMTQTSYYRGYGHYIRTLNIPESDAGKRFFLKFEGAGSVAVVQVNGTFVGEHKGAYNAFTFEITDYVKPGDNQLTVVCSNAPTFEVAPFGGDFNSYGGLYRSIWLEVTEPTCISPLYLGSDGVLISQKRVSEERADLSVQVHLSTLTDYDGCELRVALQDASGKEVASTCYNHIKDNVVACNLSLDHPHLWNGRQDPYLYTAITTLWKDGVEVDRVEEQTGFRYFHVDQEKGFFLNGKHMKLQGVSRHQDWAGVATALTEEHHRTDYDFFDEMGVNALRLAHYPQAKFMFQEADRRGYVVWEEIPFVGTWVANPAFDDNLELQLREMIVQNYNHPSICFWGLYNEIQAGTDGIVSRLNQVAHELDPYRLTTCAVYIDASTEFIPDVMAFNKYYGWYYGTKDDLGPFLDGWHAQHPTASVAISEYGAGASPNQHVGVYRESDYTVMGSMGKNHPMERQTSIHRAQWPVVAERDYVWGSYVWNMFDFGASGRFEGDSPNQNDKGLVTHDRKTRKDAFYYYKANWNKSVPTVHLCSKGFTERTDPLTDIIVFTTAPSATLYLNGKKVSQKKTDAYATVEWPSITLQPGPNTVRVVTSQGEEQAVWTCKP
ncbi:MAG: beta-galactosidase, partial [Bacteroidales bacterium]|nr:beta-galactosidase [Bacteroidales bacterium]